MVSLEADRAAGQPPAGAALDLHEGICDPLPAKGGCTRWPEHLRLLNETTGELVRGRCKATNRCDYCARLFAVETSEMLLLDAMEYAPTLYVVLTARELLDRKACHGHLRQLRRALRKRWPGIEWAVLVEFQRRGALHLNLLVKGVPIDQEEELREAICRVWCARVDAEPVGQFVGPVSDGGGLVRYIALHFLKRDQAPPADWRGHRYSSTRGYLNRPAAVMREEARRSLRLKRLLWRGLDVAEAEAELAALEVHTWRLHGGIGRDPVAALREDAWRPIERRGVPRERHPRGGRDRPVIAGETREKKDPSGSIELRAEDLPFRVALGA